MVLPESMDLLYNTILLPELTIYKPSFMSYLGSLSPPPEPSVWFDPETNGTPPIEAQESADLWTHHLSTHRDSDPPPYTFFTKRIHELRLEGFYFGPSAS